MLTVKVRKIGNSLTLTLPKEAAARLKVGAGDRLFLIECEDGYRIAPYDPAFAGKMQKAEAIMARYRNTLRRLAR